MPKETNHEIVDPTNMGVSQYEMWYGCFPVWDVLSGLFEFTH